MVRGKETPITVKVVIAAATVFVAAVNKNYLSENGGHIKLNRACMGIHSKNCHVIVTYFLSY